MDANGKPYVFISYAHKDSNAVLPAIGQLRDQGVSLWYDNGIEAGSEWPEFVAEKVLNCDKFILFISKAYLDSQNCKRELNFAISRKKEILSVFLEEVELSPGMEMQLGTYQAIFRKRFANDGSFYRSLAGEPFFNACRETPRQEETPPVQTWEIPTPVQNPQPAVTTKQPGQKKKWLAVLLAFLLGGFGVHKFYLGKTKQGLLYILFSWTRVPVILGWIDAIIILCQNREKFDEKYNKAK